MAKLRLPRQDGRFDPVDAHVYPITSAPASQSSIDAAVAAAIAAHEAASDPHAQYVTHDPTVAGAR